MPLPGLTSDRGRIAEPSVTAACPGMLGIPLEAQVPANVRKKKRETADRGSMAASLETLVAMLSSVSANYGWLVTVC